MKLVTFTYGDRTCTGAMVGDRIVDLNAADPGIPDEMVALLRGGDAMLAAAANVAEAASSSAIPTADVTLESPVLLPPKILAVGLNYMDHFNELPDHVKKAVGGKPPERPVIFNKQSTSATAPYAAVKRPIESHEFDYEAELGVVIGKTCRRVSREKAFDVIAGFTVLNDLTIRDWQRATPTMTMGKSWDTHCPMGPCIVTKDEIGNAEDLRVVLSVDGEVLQDFNTGDMLFDIAAQIEHLSTAFTLTPGDVIATGTSAGVAHFRPGQPFLKEGQTCRVEIEKIGAIENKVELDSGESYIR